MKRYLIRAILGLFLTVFLLSHVAGKISIPYFDDVENLLYDTRVRLTAPGGKDERIVIVAIDEASLEQQGHWPWTREKLARLVEQLFGYGVAVIGFDMVFAERDESADSSLLHELASGQEDDGISCNAWPSSSLCWTGTGCLPKPWTPGRPSWVITSIPTRHGVRDRAAAPAAFDLDQSMATTFSCRAAGFQLEPCRC